MTKEEFKIYIESLDIYKYRYSKNLIESLLPSVFGYPKYIVWFKHVNNPFDESRGLCVAYALDPKNAYWIDVPNTWKYLIGKIITKSTFSEMGLPDYYEITGEYLEKLEKVRKGFGIGH